VDTKRQHESRHFKLFRRLLPDLPAGEVWHEDSPDFRVLTKDRILGIEHRLLFKSSGNDQAPAQAIEQQADEVAAIAQEHAELSGLPPVHVSLFFELCGPLKKQERLELGRVLARFVGKHIPEKNGLIRLEYSDRVEGHPPKVDLILVARNEHLDRHYWHPVQAAWVQSDIRALLQTAIDEKITKLESYQKNCDECWLLIVADGDKPSSALQANDTSLAHQYKSPFERTYFMRCVIGQLHRLDTAP
jgi:hypothetical protein